MTSSARRCAPRPEPTVSMGHFLRALQANWWVVALAALLGAAVAVGAAQVRNAGIESRFEAVAPVSVLRLPDEEDETFGQRLASIEAQARSVLNAELVNDPSASVEADRVLGVLRFVAVSQTAEEAMNAAIGLRALYVSARPTETAEEQLVPLLEALADEIALVESSLFALQGEQTDPVVEARRGALRAELDRAAQQAVSLGAQLLNPALDETERSALEQELVTVDALIRSVGAQLAALPTANAEVTQDRLEMLVLQRRLRDLESQYIAVALRRVEAGEEGLVGAPFVIDRSSGPISPLLAALVGLVGGALIGTGTVVAAERINEPIRSEDDLPGIATVAVARRGRRARSGSNWYAGAAGDTRRAQVQALRTRVDRAMLRGGTLAVAGVDTGARDVHHLAVDLAASVAVTGRSVLLVDTHLGGGFTTTEAGSSLVEILRISEGAGSDRSAVKRMLWDRAEVAPNLMLVPAGALTTDPVDALAGLAFASVVDEARELADLVILVFPDVADPSADAVASRSDMAVLAAQSGTTQRRQIQEAISDLADLGAPVTAVALVVARSGRLRTRRGGRRTRPVRRTRGRASK